LENNPHQPFLSIDIRTIAEEILLGNLNTYLFIRAEGSEHFAFDYRSLTSLAYGMRQVVEDAVDVG